MPKPDKTDAPEPPDGELRLTNEQLSRVARFLLEADDEPGVPPPAPQPDTTDQAGLAL